MYCDSSNLCPFHHSGMRISLQLLSGQVRMHGAESDGHATQGSSNVRLQCALTYLRMIEASARATGSSYPVRVGVLSF
jgi:hypothetical protein